MPAIAIPLQKKLREAVLPATGAFLFFYERSLAVKFLSHKEHRNNKGNKVRNRTCQHHAINTQPKRQQKQQGNQEKYLSGQGQQKPAGRFADCGKEI